VKERTADRPELRAETEQRLVTMSSLRERAERKQAEAQFRQAYDLFVAPTNSRGLDAIPPTLMASLDPEQQETLRQYAGRRDRGEKVATDWSAYYALRLAAAEEGTRAEFLETNLLQFRNQLDDERFRELVDLQADLRGGRGRSAEATKKLLTGITSAEDAAREALVAAGINPEVSTKNADSARAIAFRRQLDRRILAVQEQTGKPASAEEVRQLADDLLIKQTVREKRGAWSPGRLFDDDYDDVGTRFAFESPGADRLAYAPRDVPGEERTKIVAALREAGREPSEEAILDLYNLRVERDASAE
jgi:hypothetical protein